MRPCDSAETAFGRSVPIALQGGKMSATAAKSKRYLVGLRDTNGTYRAVRADAHTISEAKCVAVRCAEDMGVTAIAVSCRIAR